MGSIPSVGILVHSDATRIALGRDKLEIVLRRISKHAHLDKDVRRYRHANAIPSTNTLIIFSLLVEFTRLTI